MGGIVTLKILYCILLVFAVLNFFKFCRDFFLMKPKNYKFFEKEKEDSAD